METVTKVCGACNETKPLKAFYKRSGAVADDDPGHYLTECKACMKQRSRNIGRLPIMTARTPTEVLAVDYLHSQGVPALPGKALGYADVDVGAFGCVAIEVKFARYENERGTMKFRWVATPKQQQQGFLADVVMLICDWQDDDDTITFHFFPADHPVFYMGDRVKAGWNWTPGNDEALKHGNNRTVMVDGMMESARDNIGLIHRRLVGVLKEVARGDLRYQRFSAIGKGKQVLK